MTEDTLININHKFHLNALEMEIQERQKVVNNLSGCSMREIDKAVGLQHCMGMHRSTVDNLGSRKITNHQRDIVIEKQETYKDGSKKKIDYGTAILHILGGLTSLGAAVVGFNGAKAASKVVTGVAQAISGAGAAGKSYSETLDSGNNAKHTGLDHIKEQNNMLKNELKDGESRTRQQNDQIINMMQQYWKGLNDLITALSSKF